MSDDAAKYNISENKPPGIDSVSTTLEALLADPLRYPVIPKGIDDNAEYSEMMAGKIIQPFLDRFPNLRLHALTPNELFSHFERLSKAEKNQELSYLAVCESGLSRSPMIQEIMRQIHITDYNNTSNSAQGFMVSRLGSIVGNIEEETGKVYKEIEGKKVYLDGIIYAIRPESISIAIKDIEKFLNDYPKFKNSKLDVFFLVGQEREVLDLYYRFKDSH